MAQLSKKEKQILKQFGNDPNYRIEVDSRNKITAIQINDKVPAKKTKSLRSINLCLAFVLVFWLSACSNKYQAWPTKTNKFISGKIDSIETVNYKGLELKFYHVNGQKVNVWNSDKKQGDTLKTFVKRLIVKP